MFAPKFPTSLSAERGVRWLIARQQPDGSLEGASSLTDYYKAPFALTVNGYNAYAEKMFDYIAKTFLKENGDLDGRNVRWFDTFRIYAHAWLTIAALMRGRFEIAHSLLRLLIAFHDDRSGGFFATAAGQKRGQGRQEVMSTSLSGLACLWAGRLDVAVRTGEWLQNLFAAQPDLSKGLYHVWDSARGLVTVFPQDEAKAHLVDASVPHQWYFQYGISAAFLSSLSSATRDKKWLQLAQNFLAASRHCREDVYRQPASGKIGWGAAWTFRASSDARDREIAESVTKGLCVLQNEDGSWRSQSVYECEAGTQGPPSIDITAELAGLQACIELALNEIEDGPTGNGGKGV